MVIGNNIKKYRTKKGLTQEQLAVIVREKTGRKSNIFISTITAYLLYSGMGFKDFIQLYDNFYNHTKPLLTTNYGVFLQKIKPQLRGFK